MHKSWISCQTGQTPWTKVSVDYCGSHLTGEYWLVMVVDKTCYLIVEILKSVSHRCVIPQLNQIVMFSIPEVVKTDNGPPFSRV